MEKIIHHLRVKDNLVQNSKAIIVINHGFAEHIARYDYLVEYLNQNGYSCVRYDLRGHGQSEYPLGENDNYKNFIVDCDVIVDYAKALEPDKPLYILGHSMGSLVSVLYALTYPQKVEGQILSGAAVQSLPAVRGIKTPFLRGLSKLRPHHMIKNVVGNDICSDPKVVQDYKEDPLVIKKASAQFMKEFTIKAPKFIADHISEYKLPCLIVHGQEDKIVPVKIGQWLFDNVKSVDKEFLTYPNMKHEVFNEYQKDQALHDCVTWLDKQIEKRK